MTAPQKTPPASGFQFHWLSIARILWKDKASLVALWLVLAAASVAIVFKLPTLYKAECLLLVVGQKIPEKYVSPTAAADPQERLAAVSHLILSNEKLQSIIDAFGLYKEERGSRTQDQLLKQMRDEDITLKLESGLTGLRPDAFRVSYQAKDPKVAADVANRLAELIIDENTRTRKNHAEDTSQFLEDQLKQAKGTLDKLEASVSQYKLAHSGELPEQEATLNGTLARLQVELQGTQEALNRAEQTKILLQNTLSIAETSLATLERTAKEARERDEANRKLKAATPDPAVVGKPKTRYQTLRDELNGLRSRYGEDHPEIRRLRAELADLTPDIDDATPVASARAAVAPSEPVAPFPSPTDAALITDRERVANLRVQISLAAKEFEVANAGRMRVLRDIDAYQSRINRLPLREQEMAALTRDYEMAKGNYKSLLDKKLSAELATDMERSEQGEKFTLIDTARVPAEPFKPKRSVLFPVGAMLSFVLSAVILVGRRLPKDIMLGEWELTPGTVVLGRVPLIETPRRSLAALAPGGPTR